MKKTMLYHSRLKSTTTVSYNAKRPLAFCSATLSCFNLRIVLDIIPAVLAISVLTGFSICEKTFGAENTNTVVAVAPQYEEAPMVAYTLPEEAVTQTLLLVNTNQTNIEPTFLTTSVTAVAPEAEVQSEVKEQPDRQSTISDSVRLDVPSYNQQELGLDTGCEIVSLGMMINYSSVAYIEDLVNELPRSLDPNLGFRGNPATPDGFTVFPSALLDVTEHYLDGAVDMTGGTVDDLKDQLQKGAPVVVWVNGLGWNVHAITITGYDAYGFYYNDPWSGEKDVFITYSGFYEIWNKPIYDTRFEISYSPRKALSYMQVEQNPNVGV